MQYLYETRLFQDHQYSNVTYEVSAIESVV